MPMRLLDRDCRRDIQQLPRHFRLVISHDVIIVIIGVITGLDDSAAARRQRARRWRSNRQGRVGKVQRQPSAGAPSSRDKFKKK